MKNNKALEIASGYGNLLKSSLGLSSEQDMKVFNARRKICNGCIHRTTMDRCAKCGCPLIAKTKSKLSQCPIKLW